MKQKFIILLGILLIFIVSIFLWWYQAIKPSNPANTTPLIFSIKRGEGIRTIAEHLQKQDLIRSSVAFFLIARFGGLDNNIQAGDFRLNPAMDLYTVINTLTHGTIDVWITILEGWRNEEIALVLARQLNIPEQEFLKVAREGYMFPDTYLIPKDAEAAAVTKIFLSNFDNKVTPEVKMRAKAKKLSLDEVITVASMVEREAKFKEDRPLVASVILNRLSLGMKLDIDATVQYALGYQTKEKTWWKKELTIEDLDIDSPYNTYKNPGLPPKPIANPGIDAIVGVVDAPATNYIYYISDKTGRLHFGRTIEEHNSNIAKYLNK
ncbi:endolytic transglycosylase MltG [Candidatus Gottesmanbacteria bacterium]|nr:endolytic transglycosylase MltG [Candidatus Gottesmanbacteria bacterium]